MANTLTILGLIAITGGIAWVHPASGVIFGGVAAVAVGLGMQLLATAPKKKARRPAAEE